MSQNRHIYEYQVDTLGDGAPARVVRLVGESKSVMEVGAGPGSITKLLSSESNCRVTALEIDCEAIKKLKPYCERVYQVNLNDGGWIDAIEKGSSFEVIVAADVLEHLYEPLTVLRSMVGFLKEMGYIVASIPHVAHSAMHACLLQENFEYSDSGLLDRTHIRFFGIRNIQNLFEDAGLKITHAEFVVRDPEHTEFAKLWSRTSPEIRKELAKNPFGSVYQVVIKAIPKQAVGEAISLMNLTVPFSIPSNRDRLNARLRTILNPTLYSWLRRFAAKLGMAYRG